MKGGLPVFFPEIIATSEGFIHPYVLLTAHLMLAVAFIVSLIRVYKGPNTVDRVVAVDLIAGVILAMTLLQAIDLQNENFINIGLAVAVVAFLGTIAIARYLEKLIRADLPEENEEPPKK